MQTHEERVHKSLGCSNGSEKNYGTVHVHNLHTCELFKIIAIFLEFWVKTKNTPIPKQFFLFCGIFLPCGIFLVLVFGIFLIFGIFLVFWYLARF